MAPHVFIVAAGLTWSDVACKGGLQCAAHKLAFQSAHPNLSARVTLWPYMTQDEMHC